MMTSIWLFCSSTHLNFYFTSFNNVTDSLPKLMKVLLKGYQLPKQTRSLTNAFWIIPKSWLLKNESGLMSRKWKTMMFLWPTCAAEIWRWNTTSSHCHNQLTFASSCWSVCKNLRKVVNATMISNPRTFCTKLWTTDMETKKWISKSEISALLENVEEPPAGHGRNF